jgi:HAD superfamily hydrolase (TIGR01509 family)
MLRALIWDVDGTLAETEEPGHRVAFNQAFAEQGLPWQWDAARYSELLTIAGGKERLLHAWRQVDPASAAAPDAAERIARLHARKTAIYLERLAAGAVQLRPGVERVLRQARTDGLRLAIATTTTEANVAGLLAATLGPDSLAWFDCIVAGDAVPRKKPAPDVYLRVLHCLGLAAEACLAIEDSAVGAASARAAGLAVLDTRSRWTLADTLPPVLADLDGLGEPGAPASGRVFAAACGVSPGLGPSGASGQPWQGVVNPGLLRRWLADAAAGVAAPPPASTS